MLLGQPAPPNRFQSFRRPTGASFYKPGLAPTAMYSHINPFVHVMNPMASYRPRLPNLPRDIMPSVLPPQSAKTPFPTQPGPSPLDPSVQQLMGPVGPPSPFDFIDTDPSRKMRTGTWMNVPTTPAGVRAGVMRAGQFVQRMHPAAFPFSTAGGY